MSKQTDVLTFIQECWILSQAHLGDVFLEPRIFCRGNNSHFNSLETPLNFFFLAENGAPHKHAKTTCNEPTIDSLFFYPLPPGSCTFIFMFRDIFQYSLTAPPSKLRSFFRICLACSSCCCCKPCHLSKSHFSQMFSSL